MSASVCVYIYSACILTSVSRHVCVLRKDVTVTVQAPLGRPPLLLFELNPLSSYKGGRRRDV